VTGGTIWPARAEEDRRAGAQLAGQFVKRASFTRSVKETKPAIPGHGKGRVAGLEKNLKHLTR
jgi:hypothetical protein